MFEFDRDTIIEVKETLDMAREAGLKIATAESCTGGLLAAALTSVAGSSTVFERGFVTYSNAAKMELLDVEPDVLETHGAVSEQTARQMAEGALAHSRADLAVSITGIAGPGGGSVEKPVGLVHFACAARDGETLAMRRLFTSREGEITREEVRHEAVLAALALLRQQMNGSYPSAFA